MHGFKSAILAIFQFSQNDTFEPEHGSENFKIQNYKIYYFFFFNLDTCKFLERLEGKIRKCLFFDGSLLSKYRVLKIPNFETT